MKPLNSFDTGKRLELIRRASGFERQKEFCEHVGIEQNTYNQAERGRARLGLDSGIKICQAVAGLTLDYLYLGKTDGLTVALAAKINKISDAD